MVLVSAYALSIQLLNESVPAGALHVAEDMLTESFIVYYGDVLTSMNLSEMVRCHMAKHAACTLAMSTSVPIEYGVTSKTGTGESPTSRRSLCSRSIQ